MTQPAQKTPLDAAQKIVAELDGMTSEHQALALKFSMETLGIQLPTTHTPGHAPAHAPHPTPHTVTNTPGQFTDIKSFNAAKAPKSDQQFTAVVAYYYQFEAPVGQRKVSIDAAIMKEAARQAGRKQVNNWSMTLNNALRSGYLDKAERGTYKLNSVGENLVAITLPGNATNGGSGGSKKKSAKKKSTKKN